MTNSPELKILAQTSRLRVAYKNVGEEIFFVFTEVGNPENKIVVDWDTLQELPALTSLMAAAWPEENANE